MMKATFEGIVHLVKGITPSIVLILITFCIVFCVIRGIDIPDWFKVMLGTGAGGGATGYAILKKTDKGRQI